MAQMFPKTPRSETPSHAERLLFEKLEQQLPGAYQVHHSVTWQHRRQYSGVKDGEADFVIVDPTGAILILEVKGGQRITYDGETGEWRSNDSRIADPFRQGVAAKKSLLAKLVERFGKDRYYVIGNAVAFPEVDIRNDLRLDAPREIILDAKDVNNLKSWVANCFKYFKSEPQLENWGLDEETKDELRRLLSPSWEFSPPLTSYFKEIKAIIDTLTEQQYQVINSIRKHRQAAITGVAGSGKTLVAVEKAIRLDREGFEVLILCHNPFLAEYIRRLVDKTRISAVNFSTLVHDLIKDQEQADRIISKIRGEKFIPWTQYSEPSRDELIEAFERLYKLGGLFDAVIVDEGQDFKESWWDIARACLKDSDQGIFYIFFDDSQAIYPTYSSRLGYPVSTLPVELTENCRNAGNIFELVRKLHPEAPEVNQQLAGKGIVREWLYSSEDELYDTLRDTLISIERYTKDFSNIIVMSADVGTGEKNKLDGLVFDTPGTQNSAMTMPLDWQRAVNSYLEPFGFRGYGMSNSPLPTKDDVKNINKFCRNVFFQRKSRVRDPGPRGLKELSVHWKLDQYGKLRVSWKEREIRSYSNDDIILSFFSQPGWGGTLPPPHRRYRITLPQELETYSRYLNVRLFDIPAFKGLEADGIIFVLHGFMAGFDYQVKSRLYVALSRSKYLLYIVSPFTILERIEALGHT